MRPHLIAALAFACIAGNALAGQACTEATLGPADVRAALDLAQKLADTLDDAHR